MNSTLNVSITVRELLSDRIAPAFDGMTLVRSSDHTQFVGQVLDHAQLYGLLTRVRDLGLELTSVIVKDTGRESGRPREENPEAEAVRKTTDDSRASACKRSPAWKTVQPVRTRYGRRQNEMFEVTARLKVRDGQLEGFKRQAAEMMRLTKQLDTKTLRYDWFLSADGTRAEVREGYIDADGLVEHAFHVNEARETMFREHAYDHDMTIYGEPSPKLAALLERLEAHVEFNRFSQLQGLDAEIEAPA
jgi:quinol monooxygenase YgiN